MVRFAPLLLFVMITTPLWCQPAGGFGRGDVLRTPAFQALDADKNGVIAAVELANAPAALKSLDKNGDGKLTEDEVRPQMGGRGGRGGEPGETQGPTPDELVNTLMAFDKNGDGQLTRDEVLPPPRGGGGPMANGGRGDALGRHAVRPGRGRGCCSAQ